ncbi:MAG: 3-deoxy-D-manno-octulosonic acid transferase [Bacteroidia bacterium]
MFVYNLTVRLYHFLISLASPFHSKARQFTNGRRRIFERLQQERKKISGQLIWFHCASLGEFEQGRPLIELIKKQFPDHRILLTFFSPSGYEVRRNYECADLVFYLPSDTASHAKKFLGIVQPKIAVFVKYEFWLNYLAELESNKIPVFLVSGIFRADQHFFKWYGGNFRKSLQSYTHLFLQNEESLQLLRSLGVENCSVTGDTRFDRVFKLAQQPEKTEAFNAFKAGNCVLVAGSTWPEDEDLLLPVFNTLRKECKDLKLIIAPHNVNENTIEALTSAIRKTCPGLNCIRYTKQSSGFETADIVIVDTIGMLSSLYQYGDLAYIGGGFGSGIHNILEAMAFGLPVTFGPDHKKFNEALQAIELGAGFSFTESQQLLSILGRFIKNSKYREEVSLKAVHYVSSHSGSTEKVLDKIRAFL